MYNDLLGDIEKDIDRDWKYIKEDNDDKKRNKYYNEFCKLADSLIELNKKRRSFFENDNIPIYHYTREYCTVKICIGRISGKTEYILRNIDKNDLLIVYNYATKSFLERQERLKDIRIMSVNELDSNLLYSNRFNNIWVDNASYTMYGENRIDLLYSKLSHSKDQTFIFLG